MSPYANRMGTPPTFPAPRPKPVQFTPPKKRSGALWKGKDRAVVSTDDVGARLMPGMGDILYRHFLGNQVHTPTNPLRVIAHVDIDAAYAAMEMARLGIDRSIPLAVQQWQGLIAVNYPARKYGITRHETPAEALKKCPHLVMVHCATYKEGDHEPSYDNPNPTPATHKISLDHYRRESLKIIQVFTSHIPTVEKASIDESYLDASPQVRQLMLERFPELAKLPPGKTLDDLVPSPKEFGVHKIEWDKLGNLIPITGQKKHDLAKPSPNKTDQAETDVDVEAGPSTELEVEQIHEEGKVAEADEPEEPELTWSDVALSIGAELVQRCRFDVHEQLGYTCSAGIAPNKMLAKLCSAWKKPNAQTVLRCCAVPAFLRPLPFQKIRNLGGKLGISVKEAYDAETVNDLLDHSLADMQSKLGEESGLWLWEIVRGLDFGEVEPKTHVKSMLSSKNFRPTISKFKEVCHWMNILATELHLRLVEARQLDPSLWPKTIHFTHRSASYVIRTHQVPFPYTSQLSIAYIAKHADKLLRQAIPERLDGLHENSLVGPWSNIQLSFGGLGRKEEGVGGIEKFLMGAHSSGVKKDGEMKKRSNEAEQGRMMGKKIKVDLGTIDLLDDDEDDDTTSPGLEEDASSWWTCERCGKLLKAKGDSDLGKSRAEHEDYHFARDMVEQERKEDRGNKSVAKSGPKIKTTTTATTKVAKGDSGNGDGKEKGQKSLRRFFGP